jgi:uncharacterized membrane protein YccC
MGSEPQSAMRKDVLTRAPEWLADAVPDWLGELVRPRPAPVPWPGMVRAALAICVPLSVALATGKGSLGVLPAMGGILGTMADASGPYLTRVKRVTSASVFGGAIGLTIGSVIHGHGWAAVAGLVVVAGVSGVISSLGDIGSVTGLQLLVYTSLGIGPVGALRPVWHTAAGFLIGVAWALILILPGWLRSPHGKEQCDVAAVFTALADKLDAIGTDRFAAARQGVTGALNTAYDELLTRRQTSTGRNRRTMGLVALLNSAHLMAEASTALGVTAQRVPPMVIESVRRLASSVRDDGPAPAIPPTWAHSAGALALRDAIVGAVRVLSGSWSPPEPRQKRPRARAGELIERLLDGFGRTNRRFTVRLMACVLVAGVVSEVLPLQRSYWVPLTVAIVFKPDYGSVFARALQRGLGTVAGAVLGAVLLAGVHGLLLLIPFAVLAALLPFGRSRNYGLLATFLTPLVVILIDLLNPGGWRLAEDRLIDTLIGCAIVLAIGFAPWWTSWYAHLPRQFALAAAGVADFIETAFGEPQAHRLDMTRPPERSRLRRRTYRALADLRAEFQRTMSEPPSISRRATAWWPAVVALEQVMDAATAQALAVSRGAAAPSPEGVRALSSVLREAGAAAAAGAPAPAPRSLPADEELAPVTEAVKALLGVLGNGRAGRIRTGDLRDPNAAR